MLPGSHARTGQVRGIVRIEKNQSILLSDLEIRASEDEYAALR